jgi:xylulokinase
MIDVNYKKMFLGFDLSTQQLKCVSLDPDSYSEHESYSIHVQSKDIVTTPTIAWVTALDALLLKLSKTVPLSQVKAISGCGQQHGSVYWKQNTSKVLQHLDPSISLKDQLSDCFSILESPIWMDSSTKVECQVLEEVAGDAETLAKWTGSAAFERFTGSQILKISKLYPEAYQETERISLVSSFLASLFLQKYAQLDTSDASGMNLLNIKDKKFIPELLDACGPQLLQKLGSPIESCVLGKIGSYFVHRYGFSPDCVITTFTGDNPSSLSSLNMDTNDLMMYDASLSII